jgi:hypothetical protein
MGRVQNRAKIKVFYWIKIYVTNVSKELN